MSPRMRVLGGPGTPQTPPSASPGSLALNNLTTSHSQPIYVPGKYSVSFQLLLIGIIVKIDNLLNVIHISIQ